MFRTLLTSRRRVAGLSLLEAMVTLLLTGLAFSLIFGISRKQSEVYRFQEVKERFIVDADAFFRVLTDDLAKAFVTTGTSGSDILTIGHPVGDTSAGGYPFSASPVAPSIPPFGATYNPGSPKTPTRGSSQVTIYRLIDDKLHRIEGDAPLPSGATAPTRKELIVLDGLNSASATVNGPMVRVRLALLSDQRVHSVERNIFVPGMVP